MEYPWYKEIINSNEISQGDIILNCNIPLPNKALFKALLKNQDELESSLDIKTVNIIVLSQVCDITNNKIDSLVVCPIWTLDTLIESNSYYKSSKAKESLRQGKEPAYHLLNDYISTTIKSDFSVVDFHRIYSLPKEYIQEVCINQANRLRLLPPYREHLSQAFARYFMRVGLPMDIDSNRIKNHNKPPTSTK